MFVLVLGCLFPASCAQLGDCRVVCEGSGWYDVYGPYEDYTEADCEDEAANSEIDGVSCSPRFDAY